MTTRLWISVAIGTATIFSASNPVADPTLPPCNLPSIMLAGDSITTGLALVAVLSPRMPQALMEWPRMAAVARAEGFEVRAFRDPRVPLEEWQSASYAAELPSQYTDVPPLRLEIAQACQLLNHSPAMVVARCGRTHPWPIYGVMPDPGWKNVLRSRRVALAQLSCP